MGQQYKFDFDPPKGVEVRINPNDAKNPFVLTRPLSVKLVTPGPGPNLEINVPEGFAYDMASIPRTLWGIIPRDDRRIARAATVHDYLYSTRSLPRALCDSIFLALMKEDNMPVFKRWVCYLAVRAFGNHAYVTDDNGENPEGS